MRSSFQDPVQHYHSLFCGRGESFVDSPSPIQTGTGHVSLPVSPQISGSWARMGSSNTHTKLKNTENLENTNIHDLSKVLPSQPRGQRLQKSTWGPRCKGQDPGSRLHSGSSVYLSLIKSNKLVTGICCYLQCHPCPPFRPLRPLICTRTRRRCGLCLPVRTEMASCLPGVMVWWLSLHPEVTLWKTHCTKRAQLLGQGEARWEGSVLRGRSKGSQHTLSALHGDLRYGGERPGAFLGGLIKAHLLHSLLLLEGVSALRQV